MKKKNRSDKKRQEKKKVSKNLSGQASVQQPVTSHIWKWSLLLRSQLSRLFHPFFPPFSPHYSHYFIPFLFFYSPFYSLSSSSPFWSLSLHIYIPIFFPHILFQIYFLILLFLSPYFPPPIYYSFYFSLLPPLFLSCFPDALRSIAFWPRHCSRKLQITNNYKNTISISFLFVHTVAQDKEYYNPSYSAIPFVIIAGKKRGN